MDEIAERYELRNRLGAGPAGALYDAHDRLLGRRVAARVFDLPPDPAERARSLARLRATARSAARLSHPNIVPLLDFGEDSRRAWIVSEFAAGASLATAFERGARFPLPATLTLMEGILAALDHAHAREVTHGALRPSSVMLARSSDPRLVGFGVPRPAESAAMHGSMEVPPDHRADLRAAGSLLHRLLSGAATDGAERAVPRRLPLPPATEAVLARALAMRPDDGFQSAAEFAEALAALRRPAPAPPPRPSEAQPAWRPIPQEPAAMPEPPRPLRSEAVRAAHPARDRFRQRRLPLHRLAGGGVLAAAAAGLVLVLASGRPGSVPAPSPAGAADAAGTEAVAALRTTTVPPPPVPATPDPRAVALVAAEAAGCGLLAPAGDGVALTGLLRRGEEEEVRRIVASLGVPTGAVAIRAEVFDAPFCAALAAIRPAATPPPAGPRIDLLSAQPLPGGQPLRFRVGMPAWPAFLHVLYLTSEGAAGNLVQAGTAPHAAAATPQYGQPYWQSSPPWGTDLMIAVASERPLYATSRRVSERAEDAIPALAAAIRAAQASGQRIEAWAVTHRKEPAR